MHTESPPARSGRRTVAALASLVLVTGLLSACAESDGPEHAADAFLRGWPAGQFGQVGFLNNAGQPIEAGTVAGQLRQLSGELADTPPTLRRQGKPQVTGDIATATIRLDWPLPDGGRWTYPSTVRLKRGTDGDWRVIWEPRVVQEKLTPGDQLALRRIPAPRGPILDDAGTPVVTSRPVVVVGAEPGQVPGAQALARDLEAAFRSIRPAIDPPVDLSDLPERLAAAEPDAFVEIITLREDAYQQVKSRIYDLPGTKFRREQRQLGPTREFARALLGSVDPVRKDDLTADPGAYLPGDMVGHGGLQGRYEKRLRGTVGTSVVIVRKAPDGAMDPIGTEVFRHEAQPGDPVRVSLNTRVQNAADDALRGEERRSAVVALRVSDGAVLAVANGPGGGGENLAFTATVPPGSTFKMVSALALLDLGVVKPDTPVDCPGTLTVDGRSFQNSDNFALGTVPFRVDFARSCNTAFAALAPELGATGLAATGRSLGLEGNWDLGTDVFTGKISTGGSPTEQAAAAFGQGTTLVSPLVMASATAAVARGRWQQPRLLLDPAPDTAAPLGPQLETTSVEPLRQMMRAVVTEGTANGLADVPGGPVFGKTGTAEYDDNPAHTHSWFVGWQGNIAFAVFVEKGGSSTATAVPIAEKFLRALR